MTIILLYLLSHCVVKSVGLDLCVVRSICYLIHHVLLGVYVLLGLYVI